MNKNILMATNLKVWSISKGVGAPSFYKTIELYNNKGFNVFLYTTEDGLNINELKNVTVIKLPKLKALNIPFFYTFSRLINYFINQFIFLYVYTVRSHESVDMYYGYEIEFIPALKLLSSIKNKPFVSRFQGTILWPLMKKSVWKLRYFPHFFSLRIAATLTIMTDDGTKGDKVLSDVKNQSAKVMFVKNGVDFTSVKSAQLSEVTKNLLSTITNFDYNFVSVSRLEAWKRLDRSIDVFEHFSKHRPNSRYLILGDGTQKEYYERLVEEKNLVGKVIFTGGVNKADIYTLMEASDIFLSHYELSNVGNPLWEAIHNNCLIVTLSNGDTGNVIFDNINGIISQENNYLDNAEKLLKIQPSEIDLLKMEASKTLKIAVNSWDERMDEEFKLIQSIL